MPENIRTAGNSSMPKKRKVFGQKKKSGAQDEYKTSKGYKEKIVPGNMDLSFLIIVLILLVIGIVMMFSASYAWAIYESNDPLKYIRKQMMLAGVGTIGMLIVSKIDYHILKKPWIAYGLFGIALSFLVLVLFIGTPKSGTNIRRWIYIGSFNFQPSEIMKAGIIILFAYIIAANSKKMNKFQYGMLPFLLVLGLVSGLMLLEPHLSGTIIICAIGFIMIYVGGANIKHIIGLVLTGAGGLAALLVYFAGTNNMSYHTDRVKAWLDPFSSIDTWQTQQSLIAIGSGGLFGLGLGNSRQKFLYLPESENDFVFAVVCEELGFIGAMMVIILFALFIFRGFYIAAKSPDKFGMMLAVGLTVQIGLQALLNIAVVTNSIPNTGISLPFFSYGGTALTMQLIEMGVILNISRQSMIET